jgi:hypothetical protein
MAEGFPKQESKARKIIKRLGAAALLGAAAFGIDKVIEKDEEPEKDVPAEAKIEDLPVHDEPFAKRYDRFHRSFENKSKQETWKEIERFFIDRCARLGSINAELDRLIGEGGNIEDQSRFHELLGERKDIRLQLRALFKETEVRFGTGEINKLLVSVFNSIDLSAARTDEVLGAIIAEFENNQNDIPFDREGLYAPSFTRMENFFSVADRLWEKADLFRSKLWEVAYSSLRHQNSMLFMVEAGEIAGSEIDPAIRKFKNVLAIHERLMREGRLNDENKKKQFIYEEKQEMRERINSLRMRGYRFQESFNF